MNRFDTALNHHRAGRLEQAVAAYRGQLEQDATHLYSWTNLSMALNQLHRSREAEAACRRALQLNPEHAEAWNNLGIILADQQRFAPAVAAYRRCVALNPRHHLAWTNLGIALVRLGAVEEAIPAFQQALRQHPDHTQALMHLIHQKQQACHWEGLDPLIHRLVVQMHRDHDEINPFSFLFLCHDPGEMRRCADHFARRVAHQAHAMTPVRHVRARSSADQRLRIGYLSGDFHQHATVILARELFGAHDRSRFELIGYSYGPDDGSALRADVIRGLDRFTECGQWHDADVAQRIADDAIDILVDLKGYTRDARPCILALRPAPLQVAYLGYPGTMGGRFMDYVIADEVVLPMAQISHFAESPIYLPGSYQVNDSRRLRPEWSTGRADHGLPEQGIVYCCFNQTVKITPDFFMIWLQLLQAVPGSVLWLLAFNSVAQHHVRNHAARFGIHPERLIFAPTLPYDQHLARYHLADLFLDTLPCNAHTTASDALWAGCPVVTCPGTTFAGRVGASLLNALGFPEWIARDREHYLQIALHLARNDTYRVQARSRLQERVVHSDLFSGSAFARKLERAFEAIWARHVSGLPPAPLRVGLEGVAFFDRS
ncbi:MAG: tetratricopeptide repeat protein [Magnetococcales bacterium]|nr:tetratricopeptide repeat protein [Magnetococcales bacterium]NGZ04878.1 tetratricopeptide repeat protein [Magnetococcales bacterium]